MNDLPPSSAVWWDWRWSCASFPKVPNRQVVCFHWILVWCCQKFWMDISLWLGLCLRMTFPLRRTPPNNTRPTSGGASGCAGTFPSASTVICQRKPFLGFLGDQKRTWPRGQMNSSYYTKYPYTFPFVDAKLSCVLAFCDLQINQSPSLKSTESTDSFRDKEIPKQLPWCSTHFTT